MANRLSDNRSPTADNWHFFSDFSSTIDLTDGAHGPKACCRAIQVIGAGSGQLVVKRQDGTTETVTGLTAGMQIAGACSSIETSTNVASVVVYW
jgi:hypothetical protein